jgi:hypothetical protein
MLIALANLKTLKPLGSTVPHDSHRVDGHVDLEARVRVGQHCPHIVLKEIPDPVELHDVPRLLAQPELVELNKEVAVEVVEAVEPWPPILGADRHVVHVALGAAVDQ